MANVLMIVYFLLISLFMFVNYLVFIPYLNVLKFGQSVRKLGPRSHYSKNGTPTMGGIILFSSFLLIFVSLLLVTKAKVFIDINTSKLLILFIPLVGYFVIGLIDDLLIVLKKNNVGLSPLVKLIFEFIVALCFYLALLFSGFDTSISFLNMTIDFKYLYGPFCILMFASTTNATNLTDGLDGLLSVVTIPILVGFIVISYLISNYLTLMVALSLFIVLLVFLFFNFSKAKLFMGDTGSLFIGAILVVLSIYLKEELLLVLFGFVLVVETLSVIFQVMYFKLTKGKRLFKMAPLHHHLELCGLSEIKINIIFFLSSFIFVLIGLLFIGVF